jgi:hypothetical protein
VWGKAKSRALATAVISSFGSTARADTSELQEVIVTGSRVSLELQARRREHATFGRFGSVTHDQEQLAAHAERVRASGALGRSAQMRRLFDFLVRCATEGRVPKEVEIAIGAFGRAPGFDVAEDAVVRVYVHKLRRRLDAFYSNEGRDEAHRVVLVKGEYRLALKSQPPSVKAAAAEAPTGRSTSWVRWVAAAFAVATLLNVLLFVESMHSGVDDAVLRARASPLWSRLLDDDLPVLIVVGDYYMVGETRSDSTEVQRLVREFAVNSPLDLSHYKQDNPTSGARYVDVELSYLPTAIGPALRELMPILASPKKRVRVTTVSRLTADEFRQSHIVYLGYLSGLGMLSDLVLSGSRYSIGASYDGVVDSKSGQRYFSGVGVSSARGDKKYKDYGYFSTFPGSAGNQIVVIAGARDTALINTSEEVSHPQSLERLGRRGGDGVAFEALYEVHGVEGANVNGRLLDLTPLDVSAIWGS